MTPEAKFASRVDKDLKELEPEIFFFNKEALAVRGLPDRFLCVNGWFCALELKANMKDAYKDSGRVVLQRYNISKITKAGGFGAIVYPVNWPEILKMIKKMNKNGIRNASKQEAMIKELKNDIITLRAVMKAKEQ